MLYRLSVGLIEAVSLVLFSRAFFSALRREKQKAWELFLAFIYGLILEELDIYFFRTYRYSAAFLLQFGSAPLSIAFLWSLILTSSMAISDRLGIPGFSKPFSDALLALLIDIGVDAIAIRIGYWKWNILLTEGWFGVPAGNLYSWMWVAFSYSLLTRIVRCLGRKDTGRNLYQILVPFAAYLLLFLAIAGIGIGNSLLGLQNESKKLWVFYAHVAVFILVSGIAWFFQKIRIPGEKIPPILNFSRLAIHVYFLSALLATGILFREPLLGLVAFSAFGAEMGLRKLSS